MTTEQQLTELLQTISDRIEAITGKRCRFELNVHDVPADKMCGEVIERGWHKLKHGENELAMYHDQYLPFEFKPKSIEEPCRHVNGTFRNNAGNKSCYKCGKELF